MSASTRILEEATRLLTEEVTNVREVAQDLGLSKAALYHHFRSREEVLWGKGPKADGKP